VLNLHLSELLPLSRKGDGGFGNWGATAIDALSTHHLMGLSDLFSRSVAFAEKVDFSRTTQSSISIFETTIRYVGALLSAYELDGKRNVKLVQQAQVIGDHLLRGWTDNHDLPYNTLRDWNNFGGPQTDGAIIAETGTLVIELDRLSKFSGNNTYREFGVRAMRATVESKQSVSRLGGRRRMSC
jgi:mannosyl-oligosaccharide alpha-1,2-mannosidase